MSMHFQSCHAVPALSLSHIFFRQQQQQPRLTALRLEVWLRSLLCSADQDHSRFDASFDIEKSFPDVFQTARVLARAIARHASAFVASVRHSQGRGAPPPGALYPPSSDSGSGSARPLRLDLDLDRVKLEPVDNGKGKGKGKGKGRLDSPRQALAGRLNGAPAAGALVSWVSGIVRTAQQYRRWLPWQAFADELRELVLELLSARRYLVDAVDADVDADGDGGAAGEASLEAEAAVFAVCELLLAWGEEGEVRTRGSVGIVLFLVPRYDMLSDSSLCATRKRSTKDHHAQKVST